MFNPWLNAWQANWRFSADVQQVIALRLMKISTGDATAMTEARRMFTEKAAALGEAQIAATTALMGGASMATVMARAATPFRKRVRANRKRLST